MRFLLEEWKNITERKKNPKRGADGCFVRWDRRVRWYEPDLTIGETYRITVEDTEMLVHLFFKTKEEAQTAYDEFIIGVSCAELKATYRSNETP